MRRSRSGRTEYGVKDDTGITRTLSEILKHFVGADRTRAVRVASAFGSNGFEQAHVIDGKSQARIRNTRRDESQLAAVVHEHIKKVGLPTQLREILETLVSINKAHAKRLQTTPPFV